MNTDMEFHRASLTYFSIAALCLLKPLFVLGESELHSFPFSKQIANPWPALPDS